MIITLPWPPTANTYWRHVGSRVLISKKGRAYRKLIGGLCLEQGVSGKFLQGRLAVAIVAILPDRRCRDLDNLCKSTLDSLTHAGVWEDDSQIAMLILEENPMPEAKEDRGKLKIHIRGAKWVQGRWIYEARP